jgi:alkylation response protein AidB-like acyl-CoA dehydrogenase
MDFTVAPNLQSMIRSIRDFMDKEVYPIEHEFMQKGFVEMLPVLRQKREKVKEMGLWAPHIPESYGGGGLSLSEFAAISEELGHSPIGHYLFNCQAPDVGNMEILMQHGTDEQKERYLLPLIAGDIRSCFSMTEPGYPGSNPTWMGTTAVKDGSDFVINGQKWFTSSADGAAFAICMAVTDANAADRYHIASQIIVPTDTPGFKRVRNISVMGDRGGDYASHGEIVYDNCRVPQSNLLGGEGMGFIIAQDRLGPGRIHHCMRWIGICERAFDLMCRWAAGREIAPGKPLGTREIVQEWVAESRAEINAAADGAPDAWKIVTKEPTRRVKSLIKFSWQACCKECWIRPFRRTGYGHDRRHISCILVSPRARGSHLRWPG